MGERIALRGARRSLCPETAQDSEAKEHAVTRIDRFLACWRRCTQLQDFKRLSGALASC